MKEYRIFAEFGNTTYGNRSYKRKVYKTLEEAQKDFPEAVKYYTTFSGNKFLTGVRIQSRDVTEWKEEK